ncbi:hypothetical protein [Streptomyces sp. NPDC001135]
MLLALLPLVLAPFLIRDPLVDLVQLSRGLLLDDAAGEPQRVETGQRGIVVHLGVPPRCAGVLRLAHPAGDRRPRRGTGSAGDR